MEIRKIGERSLVFTYKRQQWNLNLHLIRGDKYNYVVDTGLGSLSAEPVKKHIDNKKPVIVINTHYHWDHIWGNCAFADCVIISHSLCNEIIEQKWDDMMSENLSYVSGEARKCLPNLNFDNELYFRDDGIRIFYTPGHTPDSISVLDERDCILNAGDNIGDTPDGIVPDIDCLKERYIDTLLLYKSLDFKLCVSGHNAVQGCDIAERIIKKLRDG